MDAEMLKQVMAKARELQNPELINDVEFRVTIELVHSDVKLKWFSVQADPATVATVLEARTPRIKNFQAEMNALIKQAKQTPA